MRIAPIFLAITLCVSEAQAMWPFFVQPKPDPVLTLPEKAKMAVLVAVGLYLLVCDGGVISWFESGHPRDE